MSMPKFPDKDKMPNREEVINQIISSIAMEELGLSHIINAEGEKLQYALGTLEGAPGPDVPLTVDDLLKLNESVHNTMNSNMMNQFMLKEKLTKALSASVMEGPQGPQGPQGQQGPQGTGTTIKGKGESKDQLDKDHPDGPPEDAYIVDSEIYIWNKDDGWHSVGSLRGPTGIGTLIKDTYPSLAELQQDHPNGPPEDAYLIDGKLYVWTEEDGWHSAGDLRGPQGTGTLIKDTYPSLAELQQDHPTGPPEDAYIIDGKLYVWTEEDGWHSVGDLRGPQGIGTLIKDSYPSLAELQQDHPFGPPEDAYLINGHLYVWTAEKGWHSVGDLRGPEAPSYTIIPFASQQAPYVGANASGEPVNVALLGFGYLGYNTGIGGENAEVAIPIDPSDGSFNLGATGNENKQLAFSLPFDMKLNSIYLTTGNWGEFVFIPAGTEVFPYVQIYTAPAGTNNFLPLKGAIVKPLDGLHPESARPSTMLKAEISGLDLELDAGTRIAICGMVEIHGDSAPRSYYLYFTGGIGLSLS